MRSFSDRCDSCGGRLNRINKNLYECAHCGSQYHVESVKGRSLRVNLSIKAIVGILAGIMLLAAIGGTAIYAGYTGRLMGDAARFSKAFRDFVLEAYNKPVVDISEEDLAQLKYLKVEKEGAYQFSYSFEDYYAYADVEDFEKNLQTVTVNVDYEDFSPLDIRFFTGLTRLELYADAWQNFILPKENKLKSILCNNGISQYGESAFFQRANAETLEEVVIFSKEEIKELYFLQDITGIRRLTLEKAVLTDATFLQEFDKLESLYLRYPVVEEGQAYEIVEGILKCPKLKLLYVEGKLSYYLTEEEWEHLQNTYGNRVVIQRR